MRRYHPGVHTMQAQVILGSPGILAEPDERLLLDVLAGCGASTQVETIPVHRGESTALTWIVLAVLPLQAFLAALGSKMADDAYAQLRNLVKRLAAGRRPPASPSPAQAARTAGPAGPRHRPADRARGGPARRRLPPAHRAGPEPVRHRAGAL